MSQRMVRRGLVLGLLMATSTAWSQVHVLQVESDGDSNTGGIQYAPVNFTTSATLTSSGITFYALSGTSSSRGYTVQSGHAASVRGNYAEFAGGYISDWYCQNYWDYETTNISIANYSGTNGAALVRLPPANTNNIKVVNHSWINSPYTSVGADVRTLDYIISRDDLLMASGAVNSGNGDYPLLWSSRNGMAVRGSQYWGPAGQTFRSHPDVYGPGDYAASNTTPQIASMAAKIFGQAMNSGNADGQHHEVAKAIIMTGTSKTAFNTHFTSWSGSLSNNLDPSSGAGIVVPAKVDAIYGAGEKATTPLASVTPGTSIPSAAITSSSNGWSYISSLNEHEQVAVVFQQPTAFSNITATLAWDVTSPVKTINGTTGIDTGVDQLADLNLRLYRVDVSGDGYALGNAVTLAGLASASNTDNVEHLYYDGAALSAGYYAFVIDYADTPSLSGYATDAGFAYTVSMVPEPAAGVLGLAVLAAAAGRRRRA